MKNPMSVSAPTILIVILACLVVCSDETDFLDVDASYETCRVPVSCGAQAINYPFFINNTYPSFCGFPDFLISCSNGKTLTIDIFDDTYVIHRIDYAANSFVVSNAAFPPISDTGACIASFDSLYLIEERLKRSQSEEVIILRQCNMTALGDDLWKYRIGCDADATNTSVLAVPEGDVARLRRAGEICGDGLVKAPLGRPVVGVGTREVLSGGFELKWTVSECGWCNSTGGKCGYSWDTNHFQCFCAGMPHASHCNPPGKFSQLAAITATYRR